MSRSLRSRIASEAARLLLRSAQGDFLAARKLAARRLNRGRIPQDELPTISEIQQAMHALAGLFDAERDPQVLDRLRRLALDVMRTLEEFTPLCTGAVVAGQTATGAEVVILTEESRVEAAADRLRQSDRHVRRRRSQHGIADDRWEIDADLPCQLRARRATDSEEDCWTIGELEQVVSGPLRPPAVADEALPAAEIREALRLLLEPLGKFRMHSELHPEGDALYHSLQVFELGRAALPFDEEFLVACLLHDVGLAVDPRHPVPAALQALRGLVTDRTLFLIEHRPAATDYLKTGVCPRSLRKSPDFEELLLLARCNRDGCVAGAAVCTLDEALDYLAGIDSLWDDESPSPG